MTDYDRLLERAMQGQLTPKEIETVAHALAVAQPPTSRYVMIDILSHAFATAYQPSIERFLRQHDDPHLTAKALRTLFGDWGIHNPYLEDVVAFLDASLWDTDGFLRLTAISLAGDYLRNHPEPRLLGALLQLFASDQEDKVTHEAAWEALARAMGREWTSLRRTSRYAPKPQMDPTILSGARQRLLQELAQAHRDKGKA